MSRSIFLLFCAVAMVLAQPRAEHPRPDWVRTTWQTLNGSELIRPDASISGNQRGGTGFRGVLFRTAEVHIHNNRVYLNNAPYYLKMVLDQGYWPDGLLTAPTEEALQYDIKMTKAFGFSGARKHGKVEYPRWL